MYLMAIHVPIFVDGINHYVEADWQRDLILTRDWIAKPFGGLILLAPSLPTKTINPDVMKLVPIGRDDGIVVVPSFDSRCRVREFWIRQRLQWLNDVRRELKRTKVIQTSMTNFYRPLAYLAHSAAVDAGVPTVFVGPDMDVHARFAATAKGRIYCAIYDRIVRRAVRNADLTLLKEGLVYDRYSGDSKNAEAFCHTMYSSRDVVGEAQLESRLETLKDRRRLKAVYAGRFVERKGLRDSIAAIAESRKRGLDVEFHLFGSGPDKESLQRLAEDLGVGDLIQFRGYATYNAEFIAQLSTFDLLLFTPIEEDTPRMLYDAMAAGLPLIGSNIPFLSHRAKSDQIGVVVDIGDSAAAALALRHLRDNPEQLKGFSRAARIAGERHSIEKWYQRRSDWTRRAVDARMSNLQIQQSA